MFRFRLAPSDEGAVEHSETEGEKKLCFFATFHFLSLRHGKAVPPPSSEGGKKSYKPNIKNRTIFRKEEEFMKICHVCNAECEDNAELCPICGADLTYEPQEEAEEEKEELVLNKPVLLASLDDVVSAEILKDLLIEEGILFSDGTEGEGTLKVTFGGAFTAVEIYVDEADFEKANQIYEDFLNSEPTFDEDFFDEDAEETEQEK